MLIPFFFQLRDGGIKVSITELLTLLEAMQKGLAKQSVDDFYFLSRACLVKDESKIDRFDRIFSAYFKGVDDSLSDLMQDIPEEWLRHQAEPFRRGYSARGADVQRPAQGNSTAVRCVAQERAGCAPVRAADFSRPAQWHDAKQIAR